jgi:hypothetical protein
MSPSDHNKTLGLIYGLIGILILTGVLFAAAFEARRRPADATQRLAWMLYLLPLPFVQILTAFGIFTRRRWGRILALILSALYVWIFPLGTLLAIYAFWFFHSDGGKQLFDRTT